MNQFFYHYILKNNFENFQKYLTKKDGKNLITCKTSLFLKKCIEKLKDPSPKFMSLGWLGFPPRITYFTVVYRKDWYPSNQGIVPAIPISRNARKFNSMFPQSAVSQDKALNTKNYEKNYEKHYYRKKFEKVKFQKNCRLAKQGKFKKSHR